MSMIHDLMSYEEDYLLVQRSVVSTIAKYTEKQMDLKTINDREYKEKFESIAKRGQDIIDIISSIKDIQVKELKNRIKLFIDTVQEAAKLLPEELNIRVGDSLHQFLICCQSFILSHGKIARLLLLKQYSEVLSNLAHPLIPLGV